MAIPRSVLPDICWPSLPSTQDAQMLAILSQLEQSQWWSPEALLAHQLQQIYRLIKYAAETVPFYKNCLQAVAKLPSSEFTLAVFQSLPLLTRADIQRVGKALCGHTIPKGHGKSGLFCTSGSSGQPMQAVRTALDLMFTKTVALRYHLWHKHDFSAKNVSIKTVKKLPTEPMRWVECYPTGPGLVYDIATPVEQLTKRLCQDDPAYLRVHPSTLQGMIQYSQRTKQIPRQLKQVCTFGEVVEDSLRELCQEVWGVPITDVYSAEEIGLMALQCPDLPVYHLQSEHVFIEILNDDNKPCQVGEMGRVVVTQLHNFSMPLIRYDIRDTAEVGAPCSCGRGLPVINKIFGRVRNLVTLPNGDKLHPVFSEEKMLAIAPIKQYQLIQKDLNRIEVKLAVAKHLTAVQETKLVEHFSKQFHHRFDYHFIYCDDIVQHPNGKYEVFRSEVE